MRGKSLANIRPATADYLKRIADDERLDKYGREIVFKSPPTYYDAVGKFIERGDIGMYGPHTKPNRATRRQAGIRSSLATMEAFEGYSEMLQEIAEEGIEADA